MLWPTYNQFLIHTMLRQVSKSSLRQLTRSTALKSPQRVARRYNSSSSSDFGKTGPNGYLGITVAAGLILGLGYWIAGSPSGDRVAAPQVQGKFFEGKDSASNNAFALAAAQINGLLGEDEGKEWVSKLKQAAESGKKTASKAVSEAKLTALDAIDDPYNFLYEQVSGLLGEDEAKGWSDKFKAAAKNPLKAASDAVNTASNAAKDLSKKLTDGADDAYSLLAEQVNGLLGEDDAKDLTTKIKEAAKNALNNPKKAVSKASDSAADAGEDAWNAALEQVNGLLGKDDAKALSEKLNSAKKSAGDAYDSVAASFRQGLQDADKVASLYVGDAKDFGNDVKKSYERQKADFEKKLNLKSGDLSKDFMVAEEIAEE